jgi:hypothetical protein
MGAGAPSVHDFVTEPLSLMSRLSLSRKPNLTPEFPAYA